MWSYCLVLFVVYIYNLLTIGSGALCFMHLVSGRSLNIFLANFFNGLGHGLSGSGLVNPQKKKKKNRVDSCFNLFLLWNWVRVKYFSVWVMVCDKLTMDNKYTPLLMQLLHKIYKLISTMLFSRLKYIVRISFWFEKKGLTLNIFGVLGFNY